VTDHRITGNIMVQGTMSGAGKSLLCGALCRIFRQDGYRAVPFKSQNMALNSYITSDGLEMGRAQVMQAEAAGVEPDVRMNPILLKPSSDVGSQVIVNGRVLGDMEAREYFKYKERLIPDIMEAYRSLAEENDIVVIEGAGSPAEINLKQHDIVNMGLAEMVDAPVLLAGDIDRGGVFAQLYGTAALLEENERRRIKGMLINKFRGDKEILMPGVRMIEEKTGIPVLGIIPYLHVDIDEEDSLAPRLSHSEINEDSHALLDIAVVRLPRISNFTDFAPLEADPLMSVRYISRPEEFGDPDLLILPGTKSTLDDLVWTRESGLEMMIRKFAAAGGAVLGICGGYQMLGEQLDNPEHTEGKRDSMKGLSLLPVQTVFTGEKTRTRVHGEIVSGPLAGASVDAYEIHMGKTEVSGDSFSRLENETAGGEKKEDGCSCGNVFGTYLHGLFDSGEATEKLGRWLCSRKGISYTGGKRLSWKEYENQQYDKLAEKVRESLDMDAVYAMSLKK
jgi:adenosylcobyric acid synthase